MSESTSTYTVVIIDDRPEDRATFRRHLERATDVRYTIMESGRAQEGMDMCVALRPDCILLDYHLAGMDGLTILAALRQAQSGAAIVLITGMGDEQVAVRAIKAGAQEYLAKDGLTAIMLRRAVRQALVAMVWQRDVAAAQAAERVAHVRADQRARELEAVITAIDDGLIVYDRAGTIVQTNRAQRQMLGHTALAHNHDDLTARANRVQVWDMEGNLLPVTEWPVTRALRGETLQDDQAVDITIQAPDAPLITVNVSAIPLRDEAGMIVGAVCVSRDVTLRRRAEEERAHILSIVAHELKTPLTSQLARVQLAQRRLKRGVAVEPLLLEQVESDIGRMNRLINDLLDASRLTTATIDLDIQPIDLGVVVQHAVESQHLVTGRTITVVAPTTAVSVAADAIRTEQIITNLFSNALKYSPASTSVTITVTSDSERAHVAVVDQGPGIPPDALGSLFERFYRVPTIEVQSGSGVGLGLGLYICRQLVERQNGTIGVESTVGTGSRFWFTLPLVL